jgi:NAD-dependent SIR2 family protein deacetylase
MIVRRLASRRLVRNGSTEEEPRRKRAARFLVLIVGSGIFAGTAAALGIWPFGSFQAMYAEVFPTGGPSELSAASIFPSVAPIQKTVDVYQTPRPVRRSQPTAAPTSRPAASPSAAPTEPPDD